MLDIDTFSRTVALIYDSSMDVTRWPDVLSVLGPLFGGRGAQIGAGTGLDSVSFLKVWGWSDAEMAEMLPRFLALTPTDPRAPKVPVPFYKPSHCRQMVSDEVLWASLMYRDVLAPMGIEYSMYVNIPIHEGFSCVLSVMRGPQQNPFTTSDCEDFGRLVPHIGRAVTMHGAFHRYREELATVKTLLDGVPLGMIVVSDDELKLANSAARTLLAEADALCTHDGQLRGVTRRADADLREAVCEARNGPDQPIGLALPIDHAEPIRAVVRRLQPTSSDMLGAPAQAVALYLSDPRKPTETSEEVLQHLFGLTPREATVLRVLVDGGTPQDVARHLRITRETVRSHIKHIKNAMGARRHFDLVRMVLSSPAWIAVRSTNARVSSKDN